jgi:2-(1,2-epoxy-1,2-dihydrophenyl)acetyl-CoA isomerase
MAGARAAARADAAGWDDRSKGLVGLPVTGMDMSQVLYSHHGRVGLITLNRPEKLNALADRMRDELAEIADVAYLHDLVTREDWDAFDELLQAGARVVSLIDGLAKPVLAAVNGIAAGGGANLALACDIRVAAASASIGQTFGHIGLQPDWGGTHFLPRLVGLGRGLELVLTGDILSSEEAFRIGLFNRVVGDDAVVDETLSLADRIARGPSRAIALAKASIRHSSGSLADALERERQHQGQLIRTEEARTRIRAFLERRAAARTKDEGT